MYIDRSFTDATDQEVAYLTGEIALIARQAVKQARQPKTIELFGMHGVIKDQTYVQASLFVNENIDKITTKSNYLCLENAAAAGFIYSF